MDVAKDGEEVVFRVRGFGAFRLGHAVFGWWCGVVSVTGMVLRKTHTPLPYGVKISQIASATINTPEQARSPSCKGLHSLPGYRLEDLGEVSRFSVGSGGFG